MVPMDKLLKYLEDKGKYENAESESKYSKSNWCDLGKENYQKELENCKSGD